MPITNTNSAYGTVTKSFHWLTALLILTVFPIGLIAQNLPYDTGEQLARKALFFSLHKTFGVTLFFVALLRILWALTQSKPALLNADERLEAFAAETVHWLLYISLIIVPLSGWLHHAASEGFAPIWWPLGQSLPFIPKSESVAHFFSTWHFVFTKVLAVSLILHILGAVKHAVIDKDQTLQRMWFGKNTVGNLSAQKHTATARTAALIVYAIAVIGASALSFNAKEPVTDPIRASTETEQTSGNWQVIDGTLALSIVQFGNTVDGQFDNWQAVIDFDETVLDGFAGSVLVTIDIPSLTLGSVTDQAKGPDYFDSEAHPTALFEADILALGDGQFDAVGTLTLRGVEAPLILPFVLTAENGIASMEGIVTTDRRDFSIGDNMQDESSLAFGVDLKISITAHKISPE
ncbi:MAG: cytochrome b/b6 domain-containing protein [Pseudoruegeria sp.]